MINLGESTLPLVLAVLAPAAFAALLGYFMFYGRISDVYLGVITLTVTLILFNSVNSTAGPEFHIGAARLGGFNGIPGIPPLNVPFVRRTGRSTSKACSICRLPPCSATYFGLRALLASRFGRVMVAIRENERPGAASRLRSPRLQARDLHDRRGARRLRGLPVRQLGLLRQPDDLRPRAIGADHHLGDRRRPGHADRADRRLHRHSMADRGAWRERAERRDGVDSAPRQRRRSFSAPSWSPLFFLSRRASCPRSAILAQPWRARARRPPNERAADRDSRARHALRRRAGGAGGGLRPRRAGAPLPDRPERRRQEHVLQDADRTASSDLGHGAISRPGHLARGAA